MGLGKRGRDVRPVRFYRPAVRAVEGTDGFRPCWRARATACVGFGGLGAHAPAQVTHDVTPVLRWLGCRSVDDYQEARNLRTTGGCPLAVRGGRDEPVIAGYVLGSLREALTSGQLLMLSTRDGKSVTVEPRPTVMQAAPALPESESGGYWRAPGEE